MRNGITPIIFLFVAWHAPAFASPLSIETKPSHSRLSLRLDESVETVWKETPSGFDLLIKRFTPSDLGLEEGARFQDVRARVEVKKHQDGTLIAGAWKFPSGEEAPDVPRMETFRFRETAPSRSVVDFWVKPGPTVREARIERAKAHRRALIARAEERAQKRIELRAERLRKREVGSDLAQYCQEPLSEQSDVFLRFDPVHSPFDLSAYLPLSRPDRDYPFLSLRSAKGSDGADARSAFSLYTDGKPGLTVKAIEVFLKSHPTSSLKPEMRFLLASALWRLDQKAGAESILFEVARSHPDSAPGFHARVFLARRAEERGDFLSAYESYQALLRRQPDHKLAWVFRMGAAEALFSLRQTERGIRELQWVVEHGPGDEAKAEGAFRIGDFHMQRAQYAQALAAYYKASSAFPEQEKRFPSVLVNRGEALYWLGEGDRAAEAFASFLEKNSGHPAGWRAAYRRGEIQARKPGSSPSDPIARAHFTETANRFPASPGAVLARLRLLSCGDHGGLDAAGAKRFLSKEAAAFDGQGEVRMELYGDFSSLVRIRSLVAFSEREEALAAIARFEETRAPGVGKAILNRYFPKLFRATIDGMLEQGRVVDALDVFRKHSALYRKNLDTLDMEFLLRLAGRASELNLGALSQEVATFYRETSKYGYSRGIASNLDESLQMERRLEKSEELSVEARAIWQKEGIQAAERIRELLSGVLDESPFSAEREILLGFVAEGEKKWDVAIRHSLRAKAILPARLSAAAPRLLFWTAELFAKAGKPGDAVPLWNSLEGTSPGETDPTGFGLPGWDGDRALVLRQAEAFEKAGKWKSAALAYDRLAKGEGRDNRVLYGLAKSIERAGGKGSRERAKKLLEEVAGSKTDDFWKRLATESLAGNGNQGG